MLGDWKRACSFRTLVDSALAGSHALALFFSAPISLDDRGSVITSTTTQKPTTTHLVQLPAGISASFFTPFIDSPLWFGYSAGVVRDRAEHGHDPGQRKLRHVVDVADQVRAGRLEQAQAPVLLRYVDALHITDRAASPELPADRLAQRPVHAGQLRRRQATQVELDEVEPDIFPISHWSPRQLLPRAGTPAARLVPRMTAGRPSGHPGKPGFRP